MKTLSLILTLFLGFYEVGSVSLPDVIEWPIYTVDHENYYDYSLNITLGTPPQTIQVSLGTASYEHDLRIDSKTPENFGAQFEDKKSSTCGLNGEPKDPSERLINEIRVKDTFQFNGIEYKDVPFKLIQVNAIAPGFLGFSYLDGGKMGEFWQRLFKDLPSNIVTIALENDLQTGAITAGGYDTKRCKNDWKVMKEIFYKDTYLLQNHFGPKISNFRFGKGIFKPSFDLHLYFHLDSFEMGWPTNIYNAVLQEMGSKNNRTGSCDIKKNIDIRMGKTVLSLTSDEYLIKNSDGSCRINGDPVDDKNNEFILSNVIFKRHCIFFDHQNKKFGFASRRHSKEKKH